MTCSLCIISPDKETAQRLVDNYSEYFDEVIVEYAPNIKDFSKARNKALKKVKTDLWFWCDTDDDIENIEKLPELIQMMEQEELDQIFLPYEYLFSDASQEECVAVHYRERLIRTSHPFKWVGKAHETLDSPENPKRLKVLDSVSIKHAYKSPEEVRKAHKRNVEIFRKSYDEGDRDPRTLYYLGIGLFGEATYENQPEMYKEAADLLFEYTKVSGWEEQKYDAWMKIADCLLLVDEYDRSINALFEGMKILPNWPDAYLRMGDLYLHMGHADRAVDWLMVGISKPRPETMEIQDPTAYTYRPLISLAMSYFSLARIDLARQRIEEAAKFNPRSKAFQAAYKAITTAHTEEQTIKAAAWLGKFVEQQGNVRKYIDGLPPFIRNDLRLRPLFVRAHPASKWPQRSIVFYCGEQWEEWGPDTLDKGMGGSEEAVVYLSRELAKLGWQVTVYNQRVEEYADPVHGENPKDKVLINPVHYKPWEHFNPEDEFDVFVAWRMPMFAPSLKIKARLKCVDMHDTPWGHQLINKRSADYNDLFFFKGNYQRKYADLPDEKCVVVSNGIVPEQFKDLNVKRNPHKAIYASSADRGLDVLLEIWPKIKKKVPDAELVWAYGWNSYDGMHKGSTEHSKWKWDLVRKMFELGVKELGRLSHQDLAKEMATCGVWAYPTSFAEINCCVGDTLVDMPRDYSKYPLGIPIKELVGKQPLVWTFNETTGQFELKRVDWVKKTRENAEVIKVNWDDGTSLRVTPDHQILTYKRGWVEAKDLKVGESAVALRKHMMVQVSAGSGRWPYEHRVIAEHLFGEIPKGHHVDHIDGNPFNNSPENLQILSPADHGKKTFTGKVITPQAREKATIGWRKWAATEPGQKHLSKTGTTRANKFWAETFPSWSKEKQKDFIRRRVETRKKTLYNHKVVSIQRAGQEDVYDMQVEDNHNFIAGGVVIHNCISAIKMQAAGVQPITSGFAALQETVLKPETEIEDIHDKPEELDKFVDRVVEAMKNPLPDAEREKMSQQAIDIFGWSKVASKWSEVLWPK